MSKNRKNYDQNFKGKIALEAIKEANTMSQIASNYGVHPELVRRWRKVVSDRASELFEMPNNKELEGKEELIEELYKEIGKLKVELDWLKKKLGINNTGKGFIN